MNDGLNGPQVAAVEHRHRWSGRVSTSAARTLTVSGRRAVTRPRVGAQQTVPGAVLVGWRDDGATTPQTGVDVCQKSISLGSDVDQLLVGWKFHSTDALGICPDSLHRQPVAWLHWQSLHAHSKSLFEKWRVYTSDWINGSKNPTENSKYPRFNSLDRIRISWLFCFVFGSLI